MFQKFFNNKRGMESISDRTMTLRAFKICFKCVHFLFPYMPSSIRYLSSPELSSLINEKKSSVVFIIFMFLYLFNFNFLM